MAGSIYCDNMPSLLIQDIMFHMQCISDFADSSKQASNLHQNSKQNSALLCQCMESLGLVSMTPWQTVPPLLRSTAAWCAMSSRVPRAQSQSSHVPTDRCDLWPSGGSLCLIRRRTSCWMANWPLSLQSKARAPPASVCSLFFCLLTAVDQPAVSVPRQRQPWRLGLKRFSKRERLNIIAYNLKFWASW